MRHHHLGVSIDHHHHLGVSVGQILRAAKDSVLNTYPTHIVATKLDYISRIKRKVMSENHNAKI